MDDDEELLNNEYKLSSQLITDGEPIRCVTTTTCCENENESVKKQIELLSGSEGGVISRTILPSSSANGGVNSEGSNNNGEGMKIDNEESILEIQPGGSSTLHPHQIVAISSPSSSSSSSNNNNMNVYATGCKDGNVRIFDSKTHQLKFVLEGHTNAVTSLSWIEGSGNDPWLVSGSWDGTAKIWSISSNNTYNCLTTLSGHENTVSVCGLPSSDSDTNVRMVVTVSAGIAEGNVIKGHTVRIWKLLVSSTNGSSSDVGVKSELVNQVANDHSGPMRDVTYDPETHSIYTCSNDGTVKIRSATDGKCMTTLAYPGSDRPMFLSLCVVGNWKTKAVIAGAEDGNVVIWDVSSSGNNGTMANRETQVIAHPGCVWKVIGLDNSSSGCCDFVTACNDGKLRIFTRTPSKVASSSILSSFEQSVSESLASRSSGPTPDEIAKLPKWEMNALNQGRSEGQVQVFNKNGKAIAAQWSAASGTWIEVGEVTGQNINAGTLNGKQYDHVLPIEIDVPGGGVQKLHIGYNNGENPFVTAQTFIDEHMLDQGYLAQIADYIRQRAGESGPTLGGGGSASGTGAGGGGGAATLAMAQPTPMEVTPIYDHVPMKGYKIFDAGVDKKGLTKVLAKIREFNNAVSSTKQLSSNEANDVLDTLATTLSITNRYHSSTISDMELATIHKMVTQWDAKHVFPALDLARMAVLHPDATSSKRRGYWEEVLEGALELCLGMGDDVVGEVAVPMLTMRLVANSYKGGLGSANAAGSLIDRYDTLGLLLKFLLHCLFFGIPFSLVVVACRTLPHICKKGLWNVLMRVRYRTIKTFDSL